MTTNECGTTIGVVHWERLDVLGDGEQLSVVIPAYFEQYHVPYLKDVLAYRLEEVLGSNVRFRLDPGNLMRDDYGTRWEPGHIVLTGLREPWPDGAALRTVLSEAFEEAGSVEAEQRTRARALLAHLRRTGDDAPPT